MDLLEFSERFSTVSTEADTTNPLVMAITVDGTVFSVRGFDLEQHHEDNSSTLWIQIEES